MNQAIVFKEVLTISEAAEYAGLSESTIRGYCTDRIIPHSKPGGKLIFIKRRDLEEYLMSSPVKTKKETETKAGTYTTMKPLRQSSANQ